MKLADEMRMVSNKNDVDKIEVDRCYSHIINCVKSTASRGVATSVAFKSMFFSDNTSTKNFFKVIDKLINDGFHCYFEKLNSKNSIDGTHFIVSWKN